MRRQGLAGMRGARARAVEARPGLLRLVSLSLRVALAATPCQRPHRASWRARRVASRLACAAALLLISANTATATS